jgi:hypothetical protein
VVHGLASCRSRESRHADDFTTLCTTHFFMRTISRCET